jgi:hypothetical protein
MILIYIKGKRSVFWRSGIFYGVGKIVEFKKSKLQCFIDDKEGEFYGVDENVSGRF